MATPIRTLAVVLLLSAAGSQAAQIATAMLPRADGVRQAALHFRRVDGAGEPFDLPIEVPGSATPSLGAGLWEARLTGDALWAPAVYLRNQDDIELRVWRTARLRIRSTGIAALRVAFRPLEKDGAEGETDCSATGESAICMVPLGRSDLRFSPPGFAPEWRFGLAVTENAKPVVLVFVRGASLSGRVEMVRGRRGPVDGVDVSLVSAQGERSAWKQTARTDARGFFQIKGVGPGDYTVRGSRGALTTQSVPVRILEGIAADLTTPLLLDAPKRLTVTVMPRRDPAGQPWRIRLASDNPRLRRGDVLAESAVSQEGTWSHSRLIAGDYSITVLTARGEQWKSEVVTIAQDDVSLAVAALGVTVYGTITLGDRPVKAILSFDQQGGAAMESDESGAFRGEIPPGTGDERTVFVEADTPRIKRSVRVKVAKNDEGALRLDIHLPGTTVLGRVLNSDRTPAEKAWVSVTGDDPQTFEQTSTRPDGSFQMAGFEPGSYSATADAFERSSKPVKVAVSADQTAELELILEDVEHVRGRVIMGNTPAVAADIYALTRDTWSPSVPHARTNESGSFDLELPPGTTIFDGLAVHPAFDLVMGRSTVRRDMQLNLRTNQIGGTIVIESEAGEHPLLVHNGGEYPAEWVALKAGGMTANERITIVRAFPGEYAICTASKSRCVSGILAPHGTLTLSLRTSMSGLTGERDALGPAGED